MNTVNKSLISRESGMLQIPYRDFVAIRDKVDEGKRMRKIKERVLADLKGFLGGDVSAAEVAAKIENARTDIKKPAAAPKKAAVEFSAANTPKVAATRAVPEGVEVPPIKKDVSTHFNRLDESGRLFSVFKQYYACLNDACGGTVRVTMKDGICSLWNYDEWEEFAYIDLFEGMLRIAVDPRYTDALESLNLCEVSRLLSSRHNLISVQVDGLNNTVLQVLVKAFEEVGLTAG